MGELLTFFSLVCGKKFPWRIVTFRDNFKVIDLLRSSYENPRDRRVGTRVFLAVWIDAESISQIFHLRPEAFSSACTQLTISMPAECDSMQQELAYTCQNTCQSLSSQDTIFLTLRNSEEIHVPQPRNTSLHIQPAQAPACLKHDLS